MCIKKWLRLKNVCPLCHRPVFKEDENGEKAENGANPNPDQNQNAMLFDMDDLDDMDF